jgi:non-specific serine/threonine protein kinase
MERGDYVSAHPLLEEGLAAARSAGDKGLIGLLHSSFVELLAHEGDARAARPHLIEGLTFLRELDDYWRAAALLSAWGGLESQTRQADRLERAVRLWASAEAMLDAHSDQGMPAPITERAIAATRAELGDAAFNAAWNEGYALSLEEAIDYALAEPESSTPVEPAAPAVTSLQAAKVKFGGLTARERDVAALVARGQSNREIARTLVISENTVATHIGKILSKLEFESRTQIVGWAIEKGLVARGDGRHDGD